MAMELRHLRYFIAVGEEGQITPAVERVGRHEKTLSHRTDASAPKTHPKRADGRSLSTNAHGRAGGPCHRLLARGTDGGGLALRSCAGSERRRRRGIVIERPRRRNLHRLRAPTWIGTI